MSTTKTVSVFGLVDSLAALTIAEVAEIFETSERTVRRWVAENSLFRRDDGLFPLCTTAWWRLAHHEPRTNPGGDPEIAFSLLVIQFLRWLGLRRFNEAMLTTAECLLRIPVTQHTFEEAKCFLEQESRKAPR